MMKLLEIKYSNNESRFLMVMNNLISDETINDLIKDGYKESETYTKISFRRVVMNKYHNVKTEYNGITFDSKKELTRYCELKLLEKGGVIKNIELQKEFLLIPKQVGIVNGKKRVLERECKYRADFCYYDNETHENVVEDVKGGKGNPNQTCLR